MGRAAREEMDAWLRDGGMVVTASDRAARALTAAYYGARRAEGLTAWTSPSIRDWRSFAREAWAARSFDGRLLMNSPQEESLWAEIARREKYPATVLDDPRRRVAALAMEAQELLAFYAPQWLRPSARSSWQQDAAAFSGWLTAFDQICREGNLLSASRMPLELIALLEQEGAGQRPPLLVAGFDRILPVQRSLFHAWGEWREAAQDNAAGNAKFYEAADAQAELAACAQWCRQRLETDPHARLLIVTGDAAGRRGEMERALLKHAGAAPLFEFSLGVPLSQVPLARSAHLLLRWLAGPLDESEVDWLISTGHAAGNERENAALARYMRELRRRGEQRTDWSLDAFCSRRLAAKYLPASWAQRLQDAQQLLSSAAERTRLPVDWAALTPELLRAAGWPGPRPLARAEFQAGKRWQEAVDACGSLGFDGRRMRWRDFITALGRELDEMLFAPESQDAPILIAGTAESAGLAADAIWFLGADEDAWPARGSTHPFLPIHVQREAAMPHATPQLDWGLAQAISARLMAAAPEVRFSFARQSKGVDVRPSRLVIELAGEAQELPAELIQSAGAAAMTTEFDDASRVPFTRDAIEGGAAVLTAQSQCPFKAFATARLGAQRWEPAAAGLSAAQRGQLVHAVLHAVWGGKPHGIRTLDELRAIEDRRGFVAGNVRRVLREQIPDGVREGMPRRYLELEESRLIGLVCEWLEYEAARHSFTVIDTEVETTAAIGGVVFELRLDRIDRLNDGSLLVIDYKTGEVTPKSWDLPRPDDVQLPLYAGFGVDENAEIGGLAFAKVRAGRQNMTFAGRLKDARATLLAGIGAGSALAKVKLDEWQMDEWRDYIEQLARDFVAGRAEADPREYPETCERCRLQVLCRIQETRGLAEEDHEPESEDAGDE